MRFRCQDFEAALAAYVQGTLPPSDLDEAEGHLSACGRCRSLADVARGKIDLLPAQDREALAAGILERTSGPACNRAGDRLCDFADGEIGPQESGLLSMHLDHCRSCKQLLAILVELRSRLPQMAELDPGRSFAGEVMAATSGRARPLDYWRRRGSDFLDALIRRPRFAWEAAYLGTLVLLIAIGNPALMSMAAARPLREASAQSRRGWEITTSEVLALKAASAARAQVAVARFAEKAVCGTGNAAEAWRARQDQVRATASVVLEQIELAAAKVAAGFVAVTNHHQ